MEKFNIGKNEKINTLKSEHLRNGNNPIIGVIHDKRDLDPETKEMVEDYKKNADGVSSFSECNDHNKWSKEPFLYCTGMIVSGVEKDTGENISVMIHQNPGKLAHLHMKEKELFERKDNFIKKVSENIKNIKEKCESKTIDCVIFGGNNGGEVYKESIGTLSKVCSDELGFEPVVLTGPKMSREIINREKLNETDTYFDNKNRRLYIIRTAQTSEENESYLPLDIDEQSKKWGGR